MPVAIEGEDDTAGRVYGARSLDADDAMEVTDAMLPSLAGLKIGNGTPDALPMATLAPASRTRHCRTPSHEMALVMASVADDWTSGEEVSVKRSKRSQPDRQTPVPAHRQTPLIPTVEEIEAADDVPGMVVVVAKAVDTRGGAPPSGADWAPGSPSSTTKEPILDPGTGGSASAAPAGRPSDAAAAQAEVQAQLTHAAQVQAQVQTQAQDEARLLESLKAAQLAREEKARQQAWAGGAAQVDAPMQAPAIFLPPAPEPAPVRKGTYYTFDYTIPYISLSGGTLSAAELVSERCPLYHGTYILVATLPVRRTLCIDGVSWWWKRVIF